MPALEIEMCVMCVKNFHMPSTGPAGGLRTQPLRGVVVALAAGEWGLARPRPARGPRSRVGRDRGPTRDGAAISRKCVMRVLDAHRSERAPRPLPLTT